MSRVKCAQVTDTAANRVFVEEGVTWGEIILQCLCEVCPPHFSRQVVSELVVPVSARGAQVSYIGRQRTASWAPPREPSGAQENRRPATLIMAWTTDARVRYEAHNGRACPIPAAARRTVA